MESEKIETGRIINTHGVKGEVKAESWANTVRDLLTYSRFFIGGTEYAVRMARESGQFVLLKLAGVDTLEAAEQLKGQILMVERGDIDLPEGEVLLSDLIGATAIDADTGTELGKVTEILSPPGGSVLVITGAREILVPTRGGFLVSADIGTETIRVRLCEGM